MTFPELLDAAVTGTLNHAPPPVRWADASLQAELRLLRGASVLGVRWLAGRAPGVADTAAAPTPAPAETLAPVPRAAAERLLDILERLPEALPEWLDLVRACMLRVPAVYLPDLLEYARGRGAADRARVLAVGGARMAWLARFNPEWVFAACADPQAQFTSGPREGRPTALRWWRVRDPERARLALQDTWRAERADQRAALLEALEVGLSPADENFLERVHAVTDGRRDVRETARRLIRRVPGSHFGQRWSARAREILEVVDGKLVVHEPNAIEPAWIADGLDERPPHGLGTTAWLARQVLALTPPDVWPSSMLVGVGASEWPELLREALAEAVAAYASSHWCAELLVARVDPECALGLVGRLPGPWSLEFSQVLLPELPGLLRDGQQSYAAGLALLRHAAWRLDPSVQPRVETWLDAEIAAQRLWLRPALDRLATILNFRRAMRAELGGCTDVEGVGACADSPGGS